MNTDLQIRAEQFTLLKLLGSQKQLLGQPLERLVLVMGKHHTTEVGQDLGVLNRALSCSRRGTGVRNPTYNASNTRGNTVRLS